MKSKILRCPIFAVLISFFLIGCSSTFKVNGDVKLKTPDYQIEDMGYYDWSEDRVDRKIAKEIEQKLMKSSLEESGYFFFMREFSQEWSDTSIYVTAAVIPATLGTATLLYLVGVPTNWDYYEGTLTLYLFDSNGDFIKKFSGNGKTTGVQGLYYNTFDGDKAVSKAINEIFDDMEDYADDINKKLKYAGPNSPEKEKKAFEKIKTYLNEVQKSKKSSSSSSASSYSSTSSYSSSSTSTSSDTQKILDSLNETSKQLTDWSQGKCSDCNGTGVCPECKGSGKYFNSNCWKCGGTGKCRNCGGDGDWIH